ncbi:unnamed protein product [Echinostoma caproni]|uniref:Tubulin--tyrosine ligase-like protein 9 n=1 Tax=Echinostoma caproni TaxID=27848 RepID=A0A183BGC1_9TREM|nr:unnamed protein product [Echinostoma caproni]
MMVKNWKRLRRKFEKDFGKSEAQSLDFIPTTYELPVSLRKFVRQLNRDFVKMEYHMFIEEFRKSPGSVWIMKPVARSQGRGIFLFRKLKDIEAWKRVGMVSLVTFILQLRYWSIYLQTEHQACGDMLNRELPETYVVSKYIDNPFLLCGRKFDLRVYVLVTSVSGVACFNYISMEFSSTP